MDGEGVAHGASAQATSVIGQPLNMQELDFEQTLEKILVRDTRYQRDAYLFVREALDHTHKMLGKSSKGAPRHVTGQELLDGIRSLALEQFGPMAMLLLNDWGVQRCEDFGEIVFNMVDTGLLGKTEKDSREDFRGGYDFFEAFRRPFLPAGKQTTPESAPEPSKA
jgi:uncharacterized repeat protein (TIGR04138 family)